MTTRSCFLALALISPLVAQAPAPLKWGPVNVSGSLRIRPEAWDWFEAQANSGYAYSGQLFRLSFSQALPRLDWQLELAAPVLLGLPNDALAPGTQGALGLGANYYSANHLRRNAAMVFPKQAFLRWKGLFGDDTQSLRVGRFEFSDGAEITPKNAALATLKKDRIAQRLIGPFGFTHVGRSFDGFHYVAAKKVSVHLLGAAPTRGVFQVDGWGPLRIGLLYASVNGQVNRKTFASDWRLFAIGYQDGRPIVKTDNRPLAVRRGDLNNLQIGTYGAHYLANVHTAAGSLDLLLWGALQNGRWGRQDHRAGAIALEGGFQPKVLPRLKPWVRGGYFHSSGDQNPADQRHGTFFQILPTPRPFARFPFFDLINNEDFLGTLTLRPHKAWTLSTEFHALRLANRHDLWFVGGGAFQPWTFGYVGRNTNGARSLANLADISVDYKISPQVSLTGYYGYALGRAAMQAIYPQGRNGSFGYVEVLYRF